MALTSSAVAAAKKKKDAPKKRSSNKKSKRREEDASDDSQSPDESSSEDESDDESSDNGKKKRKKKKTSTKKNKTTAKKKKTQEKTRDKSPNFNQDEDEILSKAFASVSEDNIVGTNQKSWEVWTSISKQYELLQEASPLDHVKAPRTWLQLKLRFLRFIQPHVNAFCAFYKQVEDNIPSGEPKTVEYIMREASLMWHQEKGKTFGYERCVPILKDIVKFESHEDEAPIDLVDDTAEGVEVVVIDGDSQPPPPARNTIGAVMGSKRERPVGVKAAKDKRRDGMDSFKNMFAGHSEKVCEQNKKRDAFDMISKRQQQLLMSGDVEGANKMDRKLNKLIAQQSKELGLDSSDEEAVPSVTPAVARRVSNAEEFGDDGGGKMPAVERVGMEDAEDEDAAGEEYHPFDYDGDNDHGPPEAV